MKRKFQICLITPLGTLEGRIETTDLGDADLDRSIRLQVSAESLSMVLESGDRIAINKEMLGRSICMAKLIEG